jgi:hypothetical protein
MSAKRIGYEFLVIIILVAAAVFIWTWKDRQAANALVEQDAACQARVDSMTAAGESWAGAMASGQAEAAFRGFAAGVHPLVLTGRGDGLDQAIGAALEMPGVTFVHVLAADGAVLASSDRKLTTTGVVGEAGTWALTASDLVSRGGEAPGTVELASPIVGPSGPAGFLWMGYDVKKMLDAARPAGWPAKADAGTDAESGA